MAFSVADHSTTPLAELVSLAGRAAVVTGAARGIGAGIAARLAEAGAEVVVADIDAEAAVAVAKELEEAHGRRMVGAPVDVADEGSVVALADLAVERLGRLGIRGNNAGAFPPTRPAGEGGRASVARGRAVAAAGSFL